MHTTTARTWRHRGRVTLTAIGVTVATLGTLGVIAAAFALSYDAIANVATASGMNPSLAWLLPVAIDGAMCVAAVVAVLLRLAGRSGWYPWVVTLAGVAVSVACNALHARPVVAGVATAPLTLSVTTARAVSAIAAVALAASVHLLITLVMAVMSGDDVAVTSDATSGDTTTTSGDTVAPVGASTDDLDRQRRGHAMARSGATAADIVAATGVSLRTAQRYVSAIRRTA